MPGKPATVTDHLQIAQDHAAAFNQEYDWKEVGETVLASAVHEYVRMNSPRGTSSDDIRRIADLTVTELEKLR